MTVAVAREYEITYGTLTVGLGTDYHIVGPVRVDYSFTEGRMGFQVLIASQTKATFEAAIATMEAGFSARRVATTWKLGPTGSQTTILTWSHTGNTGFNSYATVKKAGTQGADSGRSRLFDVEIVVGRPASDAGGRREVSCAIDYDPARIPTATFSGTWTAIPSTSALATYQAAIAAYCSGILSGFSLSNMELQGETTTPDDQNKIVTFTRTYRQLIANQSSGTLDDSEIVKHTLRFERTTPAPGDSFGSTRRLEGYVAAFDCWVDKEQTTNLLSVYESKIRPYLKSKFATDFHPIAWGVVDESRALVHTENRITATWQIVAAAQGTDFLMSVETVRIVEGAGTIFTPAWEGSIYSKYVDQGHATRQRFTVRSTVRLGDRGTPKQVITSAPLKGAGANWWIVGNDNAATVKWIGQDDQRFQVTEIQETIIEEYAEIPAESGGPTITDPPGPPKAPGNDVLTPSESSGDGGGTGTNTGGPLPGGGGAPNPDAGMLDRFYGGGFGGPGGGVATGLRDPSD